MQPLRNFLGACLSAGLLAACSGSNNLSPSTPLSVAPQIVASLPAPARKNLYVVNYSGNNLTVYAPGQTSVLRTISASISFPDAEAFDKAGNLYVGNDSGNNVTVYAPGSKKVLRTISQGVNGPDALAFDGAGNLYVANYKGSTVTVYAADRKKLPRTISQGVSTPHALAFDGAGNLYVAVI